MDSVYFLLALAIILALFWMAKQRRIAAIRHVLNRKRNSGKDKVMEELARQFIGKECIIYTVTSTDSSIQGTVKDVTDGGIVLEKDGNVEAVNLEYVTRIREYAQCQRKEEDDRLLTNHAGRLPTELVMLAREAL